MILSYLKYLFTAGNQHGLHSPFVYDLYSDIVLEQKHYYAYDRVEALRERMLNSDEVIETLDFGTGKNNYPVKRSLSFIARRFSSSRKCAQLLFRLMNHFKPEYILDLGTSLGITTSYLALANSRSKIFSLEGCPETARRAEINFKILKIENVKQITGEFSSVLPNALTAMPRIDFGYLDGNHRRQPTLDYVNQCLEKITEHSVLVLDDIHWSKEMEQAWNEIKADARITTSIDMFHLGILFFQRGQSKQDFILKF